MYRAKYYHLNPTCESWRNSSSTAQTSKSYPHIAPWVRILLSRDGIAGYQGLCDQCSGQTDFPVHVTDVYTDYHSVFDQRWVRTEEDPSSSRINSYVIVACDISEWTWSRAGIINYLEHIGKSHMLGIYISIPIIIKATFIHLFFKRSWKN